MQESRAPVPVSGAGSHTSTPQWQSFEVRMRHRRAERCLVRASLAFSAGDFDEARAATDEAKELAPDFPGVSEMEAQLGGRSSGPDLPLFIEPEASASAAADRAEKTRRVPFALAFGLACASLAMIAAASLGWRAVLQPPTPTALKASLRGDVTLPADPVIDPEPSSSASGPVQMPPEQPPQPEPSPTSTSGVAAAPAAAPLHRTEIVVSTPPAPPPPTRRAEGQSPAPPIQAGRADISAAASPNPSRGAPAMPAPSVTAPTGPDRANSSTVANSPLQPRPAPTATTPAYESAARPDPGARPAREESAPPARTPAVDAVPLSASALPSAGSIPVAAPEPAAPSRSRAPEAAASTVEAQAAIRTTLGRYEAAYTGLNVSAARAVWPSVDQRALARAFDGLASQRVALDKCDVVVTGATARATCSGSAEWTPKIGGGTKRQSRRWSFDLASSSGTWQIVRAEAR